MIAQTRWIGGRHPLAKAADPDVDTLPASMKGQMTQEQYDILLYRLREGVGMPYAAKGLPCSVWFAQETQKKLGVKTDRNAVYRLGLLPRRAYTTRKFRSTVPDETREIVMARLRQGATAAEAVKGLDCPYHFARELLLRFRAGRLK